MLTIRADLPSDIRELQLIPLADLHIGDLSSDFKLIKDMIEYIAKTPNCYCILGGDLMDTAIASSVGDTYAANLNPMEQIELVQKLFTPIKEKVLAIVGGNHENRVYKSDGIDMTRIFANQLGLADKYSSTTALLFLRFGRENKEGHGRKHCYSIYMAHGARGGRKEGGKLNALADLAEIVDADIYVCGHTHLPATFKNGFYRASAITSSVQYVTHTFVNTAAALNYGGYGEVQGYKPASKDYPVIILNGTRKEVKVKL